jgi:tetratricopeptide (TPR) repeat protein
VYAAAEMPWAAEPAATRALELAPDPAVLWLRAQLREKLSRNFSAALDARRFLAASPDNAEAKALLARVTAAARAVPQLAPMREKFWPGRLAEYVHQLPVNIQRRDLAGAAKLAANAERDYPGTMLGPWLAGILEYSQGKFPLAETELRRALAAAPRSSRVATNLAGAWAKQQGPLYAAEQLLKLHENDPGFVIPLDIAATAYLEARQPAQAEAALRRGLKGKNPSPQAFLQLSNYFRGLDRPAEALRACEDGLKSAPESLDLSLCRAQAQEALAQDDAAIAAYDAILQARPDARAARIALVRLLAVREDDASHQRAAELTHELRNDAPDDPAALDAVGWVLARQKDTRQARGWLALAAHGAPDDAAIRYHHAAVLAQLHEKDAARREVEAALALGAFSERAQAMALLRSL